MMQLAIDQALLRPAAPFGAVIYNCTTGEVVASSHNECISYITHGEMQAISTWTQSCDAAVHASCTSDSYGAVAHELALASTGAPCSMCASAIAWMGFGRYISSLRIPEDLYFIYCFA
tara:strand:+ start:755 stop:1108 length:354 start_codon:yes stop_codon:yes gene_type:complete